MKAASAKGQQTRKVILEGGYHLFIEQGYHGTSMRQIAARASIALGGIYNHFDSKESIFEAVLMTYHPYHRILPALKAARGESVEELIRDAARIMLSALEEHPEFVHLMFIEIVEFESKHIPAMFETVFPQIVAFIQRVEQARGALRPVPLPIIFRAFVGLFFSFFITEMMIGELAQVDYSQDGEAHFVDIFLHGILDG